MNEIFVLNVVLYFSMKEANSGELFGLNNFEAISFSSSLYSEVYIVLNLDLAASDKFLIPLNDETEITLKF